MTLPKEWSVLIHADRPHAITDLWVSEDRLESFLRVLLLNNITFMVRPR